MPLSFSIILCFASLFSLGLSLDLSPGVKRATGPNPLPPLPPAKPIGPDNFPIFGTDLSITVDRPWGQPLPRNPTILALAEIQSDLDQRIAAQGNIEFPALVTNIEKRGINIRLLRLDREEFVLETAKVFLRGVVELMVQYPELGTRAIKAVVLEPGSVLGRVEISSSQATFEGTRTSSFNATTNLTVIDPKNYRIPLTDVTVHLDGESPYGPPLPGDPLLYALVLAEQAAGRMARETRDDAVPSLWRFEEGPIRIDIVTHIRIDCKYSVLQAALGGMIDLIVEPGGIGAVGAHFYIKQEGTGDVASGRLRLLRPRDRAVANGVDAVLIEQSPTKTVTLIEGAAQTGDVGTA